MDSNKSWFVNQNGNLNIPVLTTPSGTVTTLASTTCSITNLYSNILSINNNNSLRSANDIFECCTSSTSNYIYYNNSSTFGFINATSASSSWLVNSSGNAQFPSLNVNGLSSTSTLAVNSSAIRGSGDLLTVSVTPSGDYLYLNNAGTLDVYRSSGNPSFFPWTIDTIGLATFRSITSITSNVSTNNVSGVTTTSKLLINSTMRSNNDLLNASSSNTGPYLFIGGDCTIGTYDTNN